MGRLTKRSAGVSFLQIAAQGFSDTSAIHLLDLTSLLRCCAMARTTEIKRVTFVCGGAADTAAMFCYSTTE